MRGQMSICQVCMFQDRREENGRETRCVAGSPEIDYDSCVGFVILGGPKLGARLAELYNLVDLAWDMIVVMLDQLELAGNVIFEEVEQMAGRS